MKDRKKPKIANETFRGLKITPKFGDGFYLEDFDTDVNETKSLDPQEAYKFLHIGMKNLTKRQKQYLKLYILKGLTLRNIGNKFGTHPTTVSKTINLALRNISSTLYDFKLRDDYLLSDNPNPEAFVDEAYCLKNAPIQKEIFLIFWYNDEVDAKMLMENLCGIKPSTLSRDFNRLKKNVEHLGIFIEKVENYNHYSNPRYHLII